MTPQITIKRVGNGPRDPLLRQLVEVLRMTLLSLRRIDRMRAMGCLAWAILLRSVDGDVGAVEPQRLAEVVREWAESGDARRAARRLSVIKGAIGQAVRRAHPGLSAVDTRTTLEWSTPIVTLQKLANVDAVRNADPIGERLLVGNLARLASNGGQLPIEDGTVQWPTAKAIRDAAGWFAQHCVEPAIATFWSERTVLPQTKFRSLIDVGPEDRFRLIGVLDQARAVALARVLTDADDLGDRDEQEEFERNVRGPQSFLAINNRGYQLRDRLLTAVLDPDAARLMERPSIVARFEQLGAARKNPTGRARRR